MKAQNWITLWETCMPYVLRHWAKTGRKYGNVELDRVNMENQIVIAKAYIAGSGGFSSMIFTFEYMISMIPIIKLKKFDFYDEIKHFVKEDK